MTKIRPMPKNLAEDIFARLVSNFPGLTENSDSEISGSEIIEWLSNEIFTLWDSKEARLLRDLLNDRAKHGSPLDKHGNYKNYEARGRK